MAAFAYTSVAVLALLITLFGPAVQQWATVIGLFRTPASTPLGPADMILIEDTIHCEDLHHHLASDLLFTACEDSKDTRFGWFPALGKLQAPQVVTEARGSIHVIDPKTFKSRRLRFERFEGPFVTHGIDVLTDPDNAKAVYIYAVNHLPHPDYLAHALAHKNVKTYPQGQPKARSQIEVFHHILGSSVARHVRSVRHPLIKTPNDLVATSPTSFFVTDDHYYPEGLLRDLEDMYHGAKWSKMLHVEIGNLNGADAEEAITVSVALTGLHNNNGLARGRTPDELAIGSAASGGLHLGRITPDNKIDVFDTVALDSCIDNPSYYVDPYASTTGTDRSGFVLGGLSKGVNLAKTSLDPHALDPVVVWLAKPAVQGATPSVPAVWTKELLFEDDGTRVRTASAAVLVPVDPKLEKGQKKAWLFTTGFMSTSVLVAKIDL